MPVKLILGPKSVTIFRNGELEVIGESHPGYTELRRMAESGHGLEEAELNSQKWYVIKDALAKLGGPKT